MHLASRIPLLCVSLSLLCATAMAQPHATLEQAPASELRLEVGQTQLMHLSTPIVRVSVADPNVGDVQVVTPQQVLVTAKAVGYTHLILWGSNEQPLVVAVSITRNLDNLRAQFRSLFPGEPIQVGAVGDLVVLSGTVSDLRLPARAAEVALLHSERIANLIQVSGEQQVQLEVRFAEVSRSAMRRAGINMLWVDPRRGYVGGIDSASSSPGQYLRGANGIPGAAGPPGPPFVPGPAAGESFDLFFSTGLSDFPFSAILSIMSEEGIAKILAEPTLVALSGQEAKFHAGGEVPIVIAQQLGSMNLSFKKFGVQLAFTPTVLGDRTVSLQTAVEVSEPDPTVGVTITGFQVPGFKTRSSETTIRLRDGQSFAIAGLLSDASRSVINKIPGLGDLPILGALFRSTAYQREETELLMVVSAHLVQPLQPDDVPVLPGEDDLNDPNDFELFLFGKIEPDKIDDFEKRRQQEREQDARSASAPAVPGPAPSAAPTPLPGPLPAPLPAPAAPAAPEEQKSKKSEAQPPEGPLGPIGFMRG